MGQRTLILSDTHLGRPRGSAHSAAALRPLWQGCDRLIINGDLAEVHHPVYWREAGRQTMALQTLCEADEVDLTILSGNHDPYLSDLRSCRLAGGEVFVTHGDVLHPSIAPWSPVADRLREEYEAALAALPPDERNELEGRLSAAQHASHHEWLELHESPGGSGALAILIRPRLIWRVIRFWAITASLAARFAEEFAPDARYVVIGHTHRGEVRTVRGRTVINTGSFWFPGAPRAVTIDDDGLSVWRIHRSGEQYALARRPLARYALSASDAASTPAFAPAAPSALNTRPGSARPSTAAM